MPELPEVETVVRGLTKHIVGQTIKDVQILHKKSFLWPAKFGKQPPKIIGLKITDIARRGKGIIISLSQDTTLLIHLKMTGQLIYISRSRIKPRMTRQEMRVNFGHPTDDFSNAMPSRHTRVIIKLSQGTLYFNDQRIFGWVKASPTAMLADDKFLKQLGPEPWDITAEELAQKIKRRAKSPIKAILLDQSVMVGLGNIYVDEALFAAGVRPTRQGKTITAKDAAGLLVATQSVLTKGIKYSGTSIINYKTPDGSPGRMQNHLMVYMQNKAPCKKCGGPISKIRLAGRGTHFCCTCQR